jgi:hypothetical protein
MDRNTQALVVTDFLTNRNQIALLYKGHAGSADMLGHGNYNHVRFREHDSLLVASVPLIFVGMNTAEKRKRHISSPLSNFTDCLRITPFNIITHYDPFVHKFLGILTKKKTYFLFNRCIFTE